MSDQFIGVDVGGTKIAVSVLEGGVLSDPVITPTNQASQEALVASHRRTVQVAFPKGAVVPTT